MAAPAFGFSFGDIVTTIGLITQAAKALRKTGGASSRYQQTALELDALVNVLQRVQAFQVSGGDATLVRQIQLCGHICHAPLDRFINQISELDLSVDTQLNQPRHLKTKFKKAKDSIEWALCVEQEVSVLKAAVSPQLAVIDLLLQLANVERLSTIEDQNEALTTNITQLLSQINMLTSYVNSEVASKSNIAPLAGLLESLSLAQASHKLVSVDCTAVIHALADNINTRLSSQDAVLDNLLCHMRLSNTTSAKFLSLQGQPSLTPSTIPCSSATETSCVSNPPNESMAISPFAQVIQAVRARVWEVILMLLYLIPTFQRFLRTATILCRGPTLLLSNNIHLEDALGRMMSLQYEHFRLWPVVEARLRCAFEGLPGDRKVQRNQYRIVLPRASAEIVVNAQNWARSVFPGSKLQMSLLFGQSQDDSSLCPRCQKEHGSLQANQWAYCASCELLYKLPNSLTPTHSQAPFTQDEASSSEAGMRHTLEEALEGLELGGEEGPILDDVFQDDEEDIHFFKRVYLVRRTNKPPIPPSEIRSNSVRSVESTTSESRALERVEQWPLYNFESHARRCMTCYNPAQVASYGKQLCPSGYALALDVLEQIYLVDSYPCSTRKQNYKHVRVVIPSEYTQVQQLLSSWDNLLRPNSRTPKHSEKHRPMRGHTPLSNQFVDLPNIAVELRRLLPVGSPHEQPSPELLTEYNPLMVHPHTFIVPPDYGYESEFAPRPRVDPSEVAFQQMIDGMITDSQPGEDGIGFW